MKTENTMNLNRENCEAYLLDYLEGRLDSAQKGQMDAFLAKNPDIAADFRNLQETWNGTRSGLTLSAPQEEYPEKEALIRLCLKEKPGEKHGIPSFPESSPETGIPSHTDPHVRFRKKTNLRAYLRVLVPSLALAACLLLFFLSGPASKTETPGEGAEKILLGENDTPMFPEKGETNPIRPTEKMPRENGKPVQPKENLKEKSKEKSPENASYPDKGETRPEGPGKNTGKENRENVPRTTGQEPGENRPKTAPEPIRREEMLFHVKTLTRQKPLLAQNILPRSENGKSEDQKALQYDAPENKKGTLPSQEPKPVEIFFSRLFEAWTGPIQENIDQIRIRRQWKQQQENRKQENYQAYWEEESEF